VAFLDKGSELGRRYHEERAESRFYRDATFFSAPEVLRFLEEAGFGQKENRQALIPGDPLETIRNGFGTGTFVVIRSEKPENG